MMIHGLRPGPLRRNDGDVFWVLKNGPAEAMKYENMYMDGGAVQVRHDSCPLVAGLRRALFIEYPTVVTLICIFLRKMGGFARVSKSFKDEAAFCLLEYRRLCELRVPRFEVYIVQNALHFKCDWDSTLRESRCRPSFLSSLVAQCSPPKSQALPFA